MAKIFTHERSCFQEQVNQIANEEPIKCIIEDLIKLELAKESEKNDKMLPLAEMYNLLGAQQFSELIELMDGRTVQFPKADSFKETIQVAICFYFKYLKNKRWDDIKAIINDEEVSSIKMGIKTNHLHQFIQKMTQIVSARKKSGPDSQHS
jgi:hypothetical protein